MYIINVHKQKAPIWYFQRRKTVCILSYLGKMVSEGRLQIQPAAEEGGIFLYASRFFWLV